MYAFIYKKAIKHIILVAVGNHVTHGCSNISAILLYLLKTI
jgi:hypothetical protein